MSSLTSLPADLFYSFCFASNKGLSAHKKAHHAFNAAFSLRLTNKQLSEIISGAFFSQKFFSSLQPERLFAAPYSELGDPTWRNVVQKYPILDHWVKNTPRIDAKTIGEIPRPSHFFGDEKGVSALNFDGEILFCTQLVEGATPTPFDLPEEVSECFAESEFCPIYLNDYIVWLNISTETLFLFSPENEWLGPFNCPGQPLGIIESTLIVGELQQLSFFDVHDPGVEPMIWPLNKFRELCFKNNYTIGVLNLKNGGFGLCGMETSKFLRAAREGKSPEWISAAGTLEKYPQLHMNGEDIFLSYMLPGPSLRIDRVDFEDNKMNIVSLGLIDIMWCQGLHYAGRLFFGDMEGLKMVDIKSWEFRLLNSKSDPNDFDAYWHRSTFSKIHCVVRNIHNNLVRLETFDYY